MCFEYFGVFGRKNTLRYGLICGGFPVVGVSGYLIFLIIFNMCQPAGWIFEKNIKKNEINNRKNNHEITLLTQKYFQVSDLYKMLIEKKKAKKHTILINMCFY